MSFVRDLYVDNNCQISGNSVIIGNSTVQGNSTIQGNLVVTGTTFSVDSTNVNVKDRHLLLNKDYVTVVGKTGGVMVNYLPW